MGWAWGKVVPGSGNSTEEVRGWKKAQTRGVAGIERAQGERGRGVGEAGRVWGCLGPVMGLRPQIQGRAG